MSLKKLPIGFGFAILLGLTACGTTVPGTPTTSPQPVTVTQTQTPTLTPTPNLYQPSDGDWTFPYPVTQGTSNDELKIVSVIMVPANNNDWGPNNDQTRLVVYAACETNTESASVNSYQFNCNLAFVGAPSNRGSSYWVSFTTDGSSYTATKRTS
jgi:hypothetical protein